MANIKSAKKRILVNRKKAARNQSIKSAVKTSIKNVEAAVAAGDKEAAEKALLKATSTHSKVARLMLLQHLLDMASQMLTQRLRLIVL